MSSDTVDIPRTQLEIMTRDLLAQTEGQTGESDTSLFVMDLMEKILNAGDDFDAIFAAQTGGMTAGKDFVNRPFVIWNKSDVQWHKTSQKYVDNGAYPFFAIFKVFALDTSEELTINCGGNTFVAVLYALWSRGYFDNQPAEGRPLMITATESPNGAYLSLVPYRFVAALTVSRGKNR